MCRRTKTASATWRSTSSRCRRTRSRLTSLKATAIAHYNLPKEQQSAIERHLDVHSFPTYKLFNREGHLLDLEIDARNLDELAHLLEQMK